MVLANSITGKRIHLRRGLRQGDPLSPYLFILAIDFTSVQTEKLATMGLLHRPFPQCKPCLLFADDTLFSSNTKQTTSPIPESDSAYFWRLVGVKSKYAKIRIFHHLCIRPRSSANEYYVTMCGWRFSNHLGLSLSNKKLNKSHYMPLIQKRTKKLSSMGGGSPF